MIKATSSQQKQNDADHRRAPSTSSRCSRDASSLGRSDDVSYQYQLRQSTKPSMDILSDQYDPYTLRNHHPSPVPIQRPHPSSRRSFLSLLAITMASLSQQQSTFLPSNIANAAETIGKDPKCNDSTCLGVWDGLLADCPHGTNNLFGSGGAGCVSSQDDTPGIFAEPWDYSDENTDYERQMDMLLLALQTASKQHGDQVKVDVQSGRYLRVFFTDGSSGETSVGEFYFTPNDYIVQFRIASTSQMTAGLVGRSLSNMERSERIRKSLRYLKVPVLRNRKRTLFFVESDLDAFGPGSAALGPPEEMSPGEVAVGSVFGPPSREGERTKRGSDEVDPRMKIDWVESFPMKDSKR